MSGRVGKSSLGPGTSWHLFAENIAFEEDENPACTGSMETSETTRLHKEDMVMFGECPSRDNLSLVICKQCQKIILPSAIYKHYEMRHRKALNSVLSSKKMSSSAKPLNSPTGSYSRSKLLKSSDNSFIRIEEVDPMDINVKIEEVPLTIPAFNSAPKAKLPKVNIKKLTGIGKHKDDKLTDNKVALQSKLQQKKATGIKDKEYNPDKHCGVWIADQQRRCTRSLTCKTHSLSLRRLVTGRKRPFDVLLAEHKTRVQGGVKDDSLSNVASQGSNDSMKNGGLNSSPMHTSISSPSMRPQSSNFSSKYHQDHSFLSTISNHAQQNCNFQAQLVGLMNGDVVGSVNLPTVPHHPRPMRVNRFGARPTQGGGVVFHRKLDRFNVAALSMIGRYHTQPSERRKDVSLNSLDALFSTDSQAPCVTEVTESGIWGLNKEKASPRPTAQPSGGARARVKGTGAHRQLSGVKRQMSLNVGTSKLDNSNGSMHLQGAVTPPSKRRHSVDTALSSTVAAVRSDNCISTGGHVTASVKPFNDLGRITEGSAMPCGTVAHIVPAGSGITTCNNTSLSHPNLCSPAQSGINLNSSLNLCQTLELSGVIPPNATVPASVGSVSFATRLPARTFAVAQQQHQQLLKGNMKDILPRPPSQNSLLKSSSGPSLIQGRSAVTTLSSNGYVYQAVPYADKNNHAITSASRLVMSPLPLAQAHNAIAKTNSTPLNSSSPRSWAATSVAQTTVAMMTPSSCAAFVNASSCNSAVNAAISSRCSSPGTIVRLKQITSNQPSDTRTTSSAADNASLSGGYHHSDAPIRGGIVVACSSDSSMANLAPS